MVIGGDRTLIRAGKAETFSVGDSRAARTPPIL